MEHGLVIGYEVVTGNSFYGDRIFSGPDDERIVYLMSELVPKGFGYFGHGHNHIDHDELSYARGPRIVPSLLRHHERLGSEARRLRLSEKRWDKKRRRNGLWRLQDF